MSSVFLSHSHADKPFARKLAASLNAEGHSVWIDVAEINIGDSLIEKIREGLDQVDYVAAILSSASINSTWVTRELDIASNREIDEGRVIVLPLLVEQVELPGFLKGKFYGDFTDTGQYDAMVALLLRQLGESKPMEKIPSEEISALKEALAFAQERSAMHEEQIAQHTAVALKGKSENLLSAIRKSNETFPSHAVINNIYTFEVGPIQITLDYLLFSIGKSMRKGAHVLDALLTMENKWPEATRMFEAYMEVIEAQKG